MYNTISYGQTKERFNRIIGNDRDKSIGGGMSMINSKQQRSGNKSPPSIMHSQAMIEKSKKERLKAFNDSNIDMSFKASTQQNSPRGTGTINSSQMIFEETIRDEVMTQLRRQLEDERKKNRDMKQIFDDTMQNMEA